MRLQRHSHDRIGQHIVIPSLLLWREVDVDHEGGGVPRRRGRLGFWSFRLFDVLDDVTNIADGLGGHLH